MAEQPTAILKRHRRPAERSREILDAAACGFHRERLPQEEVIRALTDVSTNGLWLRPAPDGSPYVGSQNLVAMVRALDE